MFFLNGFRTHASLLRCAILTTATKMMMQWVFFSKNCSRKSPRNILQHEMGGGFFFVNTEWSCVYSRNINLDDFADTDWFLKPNSIAHKPVHNSFLPQWSDAQVYPLVKSISSTWCSAVVLFFQNDSDVSLDKLKSGFVGDSSSGNVGFFVFREFAFFYIQSTVIWVK